MNYLELELELGKIDVESIRDKAAKISLRDTVAAIDNSIMWIDEQLFQNAEARQIKDRLSYDKGLIEEFLKIKEEE